MQITIHKPTPQKNPKKIYNCLLFFKIFLFFALCTTFKDCFVPVSIGMDNTAHVDVSNTTIVPTYSLNLSF